MQKNLRVKVYVLAVKISTSIQCIEQIINEHTYKKYTGLHFSLNQQVYQEVFKLYIINVL